MASDRPFALHITWTCYGTWLPGDRRGHVSPLLLPHGGSRPRQNVPGTPPGPADAFTRRRAQGLRKWPAVFLTAEQARVVADSLRRAAQARGWRILGGAVMANHVHVVVTDCPTDGPAVRRVLKGTSQAALNDHAGHHQKWWTRGGSNRYKNDWPAIENAVRYVARQPGMLAAVLDQSPAGINPAARPEMTLGRAAVLRLLDRFQLPGSPLALQQVHDLLYFLQAAGEPLRLRFRKAAYGPYAGNLRLVLRRFEGHFTLGFGDQHHSPTTPLWLIRDAVTEAEAFAASHEAEGRQTDARLGRVIRLLEGFASPSGMELLAGVHWVATHPEERATDLGSTLRAVHDWNDRKRRIMKPDQVRLGWQRLRGLGWIS
jgi:REP element-mobilizing transposase RayT